MRRCLQAASEAKVCSPPGRTPPERLRKACSFSVSTSRTPPAVADTRMRCASFLFTSATLSSLLKSMPEALNSCKVALKAAFSVSNPRAENRARIVGKASLTLPLRRTGGNRKALSHRSPWGDFDDDKTLAVSAERCLRAVHHVRACGAPLHGRGYDWPPKAPSLYRA